MNDTTVLKFLHLRIFIFNKYFSLFTSRNFFIFKRNFCYLMFLHLLYLVSLQQAIINKQMKTKLLKNEEDILFYGWTLKHYTNTSSLLFFFRTWCPTEVVSSRSNTYSCRSLSDDRRLFPALTKMLYVEFYIIVHTLKRRLNAYSPFLSYHSQILTLKAAKDSSIQSSSTALYFNNHDAEEDAFFVLLLFFASLKQEEQPR